MSTLETRLRRGDIIILDGGTGTELERRGVPMSDAAWSGVAALEHGDVLSEVHADYIRAGADVIITNTFASARTMLESAGLGDRVEEVNRAAVSAALRARDRVGAAHDVWIAGSISPMAPTEDRGGRPRLAAYAASFREQAEILATAGVDLIMLEMMRDVEHSVAAIEAGAATGLPVWVGFSCAPRPDGGLRLEPQIDDEVELGDGIARTMAHGGSLVAVMHSEVADTDPALDVVRAHWSGPIGAYPHSGHFVMPHWQFEGIIAPEDFLTAAQGWVSRGARAVGGCCGIGPDHIRLLAERLPRHPPGAHATSG